MRAFAMPAVCCAFDSSPGRRHITPPHVFDATFSDAASSSLATPMLPLPISR